MPDTPPSSAAIRKRIARAARGLRLAAPSFVIPARVPENCAFLAGRVQEVGLALFQTESCLAYTERDLPPALADLDLDYHVHLPLDLPWQDPCRALAVIETLVRMTDFLSPRCYVLHPHPAAAPGEVAARFGALGVSPERVLVENTHERSLTADWDAILEHGLSACLDIGHLLAYSQRAVLALPGLWERVRMIHAYAPAPDNPARHTGLQRLPAEGFELLDRALELVRPDATFMIEVFDEPEFTRSLEYLGLVDKTAPCGDR